MKKKGVKVHKGVMKVHLKGEVTQKDPEEASPPVKEDPFDMDVIVAVRDELRKYMTRYNLWPPGTKEDWGRNHSRALDSMVDYGFVSERDASEYRRQAAFVAKQNLEAKTYQTGSYEISVKQVQTTVQRQDSLTDQLISLIPLADQLGCYDASDFLKKIVGRG